MVMRAAGFIGWPPWMIRKYMDAADLAEFEAFYALEPWGCLPDDYRAGLVATCAANANPMRRQAARLEDMIPQRGVFSDGIIERKSEDEVIAMLAGAFGEPKCLKRSAD